MVIDMLLALSIPQEGPLYDRESLRANRAGESMASLLIGTLLIAWGKMSALNFHQYQMSLHV